MVTKCSYHNTATICIIIYIIIISRAGQYYNFLLMIYCHLICHDIHKSFEVSNCMVQNKLFSYFPVFLYYILANEIFFKHFIDKLNRITVITQNYLNTILRFEDDIRSKYHNIRLYRNSAQL